MTNNELERAAYMAGNMALARIEELELEVSALEEKLEDTITLESWEKYHGSASDYCEFFHDCFERLDSHYPCPSITSDYDKSIIFDAIIKSWRNPE